MVRNFCHGQQWIPATITERQGPVTFNVTVEGGQIWKRHIEQIKSLGNEKQPDEFTNTEHTNSGFDSTVSSTVPATPEPDVAQPSSLQQQLPLVTTRYPQRRRHPPDRYTS